MKVYFLTIILNGKYKKNVKLAQKRSKNWWSCLSDVHIQLNLNCDDFDSFCNASNNFIHTKPYLLHKKIQIGPIGPKISANTYLIFPHSFKTSNFARRKLLITLIHRKDASYYFHKPKNAPFWMPAEYLLDPWET